MILRISAWEIISKSLDEAVQGFRPRTGISLLQLGTQLCLGPLMSASVMFTMMGITYHVIAWATPPTPLPLFKTRDEIWLKYLSSHTSHHRSAKSQPAQHPLCIQIVPSHWVFRSNRSNIFVLMTCESSQQLKCIHSIYTLLIFITKKSTICNSTTCVVVVASKWKRWLFMCPADVHHRRTVYKAHYPVKQHAQLRKSHTKDMQL